MVKYKIKLNPKERIIKYLVEHKNPQSIRAVSGAILLDYKNTHTIINKSSFVSKNKIGNINFIKLNIEANNDIYNVEEKRTKEFLEKHKNIFLIKKDIESLNYPFLIAIVFGSYSKSAENKHSDIDLCLICDNHDKIKELASKLSLLPFKIEVHKFNTEDFVSMLNTTQDNVGKEIVKNNFILYGIENYYKLISPWMKKL